MFKKSFGMDKKNIYLYLVGRLVSELFTSIFNFGVSLYILDVTGEGLSFAISLIVGSLPKLIFSYLAGSISDKINRKSIIVICDLISGSVLLIYGILFYVFAFELLIHLYIINFLLSTVSVFFSITMSGIVPQIIDNKENVSKINAMSQTISSISSLLGPILGGILYEKISFHHFIFLNAISFILSAISECYIVLKSDNSNLSKTPLIKKDDFKEVKEFLKFRKDILGLICSCAFVNLFLVTGFTVPMPYIVNNVLGMSAFEYGVLKGALVVGTLLCSVLLSIKTEQMSLMEKYTSSIFVIGLIYIIFASVSVAKMESWIRLLIMIVIFMFSSICIVSINVPLKTMLQNEIPDSIRGRVLGVLSILLSVASPVGNFVAGLLIDMVPAYNIPLVSGVLLVCIVLVMNFWNKEKVR